MEFKANYWDKVGQTWIENRTSDDVKKRFKHKKEQLISIYQISMPSLAPSSQSV